MPIGGYFLLGGLSLVLVVSAALQYLKRKNTIQFGLVLLMIGVFWALVLHFLWRPGTLETKGPGEDLRFWAAVCALFVSIVLGMLAEAFYVWLDQTRAQRRKGLDWAGMIKPLFVSPLILIPMVAAFQNANIDLTRLGFPWLMILLTAFEKGFLWRHYLKRRKNEVRGGAERARDSA